MAGKFVIKNAKNGQFMFNLLSGNHQVILTSELYKSHASAVDGIESVKKNATNAERFERRTSSNGSPYFVLKAANGLEIGRSELYTSDAGMENGIESVMKNAPEAEVRDDSAQEA
ncbi:MAG: YegP family protein [Meiothermus sp.]|nr:YegP family protein [Meiothermus sp.]